MSHGGKGSRSRAKRPRPRRPTDLAYGRHAVTSLLEHQPLSVKALWLAEGLQEETAAHFERLAAQYGISVQRSSRSALDRMAEGGVHQGVVAQVRPAEGVGGTDLKGVLASLAESARPPLLLVLDGVEDPHNLGACIRTAAAAGAHGVIVPRGRGAALTPAARKAAAGGAEIVPLIEVPNLARCIPDLQEAGLMVYGLAGEADTSLYDAKLDTPCALVLGAEGSGLRQLTRTRCDQLLSIPMAPEPASLNVSVAAGVCLFEARRQRTAVPVAGG